MENHLAAQFAPGYTVEKCRSMFHDAQNGTADNRTKQERDRDYYDHKQWTDEEIAALNERGQPVITDNRIQRKIDRVVGQEVIGRTDPKAWPRNSPDEKAAEIATDTLRFIFDKSKFNTKVVKVAKNMAIEGVGGAELTIIQERGQNQIAVNWIAWDRLFYDPRSAEPDFSDARYKGVVQWMDIPDAAAMFGVESDQLTPGSMMGEDSTYWDKPNNFAWSDEKSKRILVVYIYYKVADQWWYAIFSNSFVFKAGQSPFRYDIGASMCPLQLASVYVDRDNNRYGLVRGLISLQDEINKRRSKLLHMLSVRQVKYMPAGMDDDIEAVRRELARPDGVVKVITNDGLDIIPQTDQIQGQFNLLNLTFQEIDEVSAHHSLQGRGVEGQSGRAILAQQQGAIAELAMFLDFIRDFKQRIAHCAWSMAQQYFDGERMIRITDDENAPKFVKLNVPMTDPQTGQQRLAAVDPITGEVLTPTGLAELDVDIVIDQSPDTAVIQQEQFQNLVDLVKAGIQIPPDAIIHASSLRNKKQILDAMSGANSPEAQQQKQQEMELMVRKAVAEIMETEASGKLKEAQAIKALSEAQAPQMQTIEQPVPFEADKTIAEIDNIGADTELKLAQAYKTGQEAALAPQKLMHDARISEMKAQQNPQFSR